MVADKNRLLPYIDTLSRRYDFAALVPTSAKRRQGTDVLAAAVAAQLSSTAKCFDMAERTTENLCLPNCCAKRYFIVWAMNFPTALALSCTVRKNRTRTCCMLTPIFMWKKNRKKPSLSRRRSNDKKNRHLGQKRHGKIIRSADFFGISSASAFMAK